MAVIKPFRTIVAENASELSFTPPAGRAAIVFYIAVATFQAGWATVKSANSTVGFFEIGNPERHHLGLIPDNMPAGNILYSLKEVGLPVEFPVPEGEKFVISTDVTVDYIIVRYREVDPGDVTADMPNAKNAKEMLRIFYGTNKEDITVSGWTRLNMSFNPAEMHNWPFEEVANPFEKIEVYGLGVMDYMENTYPDSTDAYAKTQRVRIWKGTEVLFHPNEDGFVCLGAGAGGGSANKRYANGWNEVPYAGTVTTGKIFTFPEPITFNKGEEMTVEVKTSIDANAKIPAKELRAAIFAKVIRG